MSAEPATETEQETNSASPLAAYRSRYILMNQSILKRFLQVETPFHRQDLPEVCKDYFKKFTEEGIFIHHSRKPGNSNRWSWEWDPKAKQMLKEIGPEPDDGDLVSPCCYYRGFVNLRAENEHNFECKLCGGPFDEFIEFDEEGWSEAVVNPDGERE